MAARYDANELRRLIAISFSTGELSKYAERWRVFIDRDGTPDDGARALVRAIQSRDKLPQLVESLRAHKPLVEWPAPIAEPEPTPPPIAPTQIDAPPAAPAGPEVPATPPEPPREPLVDPYYADEAAPEPAPSPPLALPKWLPLAAMLTGGVLLGALGTWLLARDDETVDEPAPQAAERLAAIADAELRRSLAKVRDACKVDDQDSARDLLRVAFDSCAVPEIQPGVVPATPLPAPEPRPSQADRRPPPRPKSSPDREPECLMRCHEIHTACKASECGPEPSSASDYASYQRCLSSCMSKYTRCRLTCR